MLHRRLEELERKGLPIRVGVIGCGRMGAGVVNQVAKTPGMRIVGIADQDVNRAAAAAQSISSKDNEVFVAADGASILQVPLDVIVEATGIPEAGAQIAYQAIEHRKHIVMMNVETDAVVGPMLKRLADRAGVIYTVTAGDEPGVAGGMFEWARSVGLDVVAIGKGCMHPIQWEANETTLAREGATVGINPKMLASFRDGSKHSVEATVIANGTGLVPDVRGTHALALRIDQIASTICPKKDGGVLNRSGVVELAPPVFDAQGKRDIANSVTPGVYLVVTSDNPQIRKDFTYLLMGDGPYFLIHRHYHLCAIETPFSIAQAVLHGDATMSPIGAPVAEAICIAKRDLKVGEVITGSGGAEVTAQIDRHEICRRENLLPLGLSYCVKVQREVARGQAVTLDDVQLDENLTVNRLWRMQCKEFSVA